MRPTRLRCSRPIAFIRPPPRSRNCSTTSGRNCASCSRPSRPAETKKPLQARGPAAAFFVESLDLGSAVLGRQIGHRRRIAFERGHVGFRVTRGQAFAARGELAIGLFAELLFLFLLLGQLLLALFVAVIGCCHCSLLERGSQSDCVSSNCKR